MIATLEDLDVGALVKILSEPKNALVKQYGKLFDMEGVKLSFTDEALVAVAARASIARPARAVCARSSSRSCSTRCSNCRAMEGVDEIMIDKDVVEGRKEPIRVFAKKQKEAPGAA